MSIERKYQVFVSSTYSDLPEARQELMLALLSLGMIPVGMELYPTESNNHWSMIQKLINECDYYLVLVGGRYGTLSPIGLSYTHREYVYASTKGKPVLALLHDAPDFLPAERREATREGDVRFNDFRKLLQQKCLVRYWNAPADLAEAVRKGMPALVQKAPSSGWVRAAASDAATDLEVQMLKQRIEALEREKEELTQGLRPPLEHLARGSDRVTLGYSCNVFIKGDCKVRSAQTSLTWDQVIASVAPQMLEEVPESVMRQALEEHITRTALNDVQVAMPKAHAVRNVVLDTDSFNQVKIHLRALGLIRKCPPRPGRTQVAWQLTPLGDQAMSQLLARRRP